MEPVSEIKYAISLLLKSKDDVKVYIFGSALDSDYPSDYDLAIIYSRQSDVIATREFLNEISKRYPLHFIFLTKNEELELGFLEHVNAQLLT
jgi:predicted nucleotidyltransferase